MTHLATVGGAWRAMRLRDAASSVAPGLSSPSTLVSAKGASAIAWLAPRTPGIHQRDQESH